MSTQRTIVYKPNSMTFREYDKKMRSFRPDQEYWEKVLTEENPWDEKKADGTNLHEDEVIEKMKKADRIAKSTYVLGNSGMTDVYTNYETAYEIREALRARFENTEAWGLTQLTEKYNEAVRLEPYACPDEWFNKLEYYSELIVRAKGAKKTPAEIVAHVIATAPKVYDTVTTLLLDKDLTEPDILKTAREQYRNYWRRHLERAGVPKYRVRNGAYHVDTTGTNGNNNGGNRQEEVQAYGTGTPARGKTRARPPGSPGINSTGSTRPKAKPWKKFKGFCKTCGQQGHKYSNCPSTKVASTTHIEKRTCYNCGKPGHLSRDCTQPRKQQSMFVGTVQVEDAMNSLQGTNIDNEIMDDTGSYFEGHEGELEDGNKDHEQVMMFTTEDTFDAGIIDMGFNQDLEEVEQDDVYVHHGPVTVTHLGVQWHCFYCHKPMVHNDEINKYECYFCTAVDGYHKGQFKFKSGRSIGQCGFCENIGPSDADCPYFLFSDGNDWMETYGTDNIRFLKHYVKYLEEKCLATGIDEKTFYLLVVWSNFASFVVEQGKEEERWARRLATAPTEGHPRLYWTCSDDRCNATGLQYSKRCLSCGKGVLTEVLRSFEEKTARRYRTLFDSNRKVIHHELFKEATRMHIEEIEAWEVTQPYYNHDTPDQTVITINGVDCTQYEFDERFWATLTPDQRVRRGRGN